VVSGPCLHAERAQQVVPARVLRRLLPSAAEALAQLRRGPNTPIAHRLVFVHLSMTSPVHTRVARARVQLQLCAKVCGCQRGSVELARQRRTVLASVRGAWPITDAAAT